MKRTAAALLAASAGIAALAIAVPGIASADTPQCSPEARAQVRAQVAPQVASFLAAHPDLAAELAKVKGLPKGERRAEWQSYRRSHEQEIKDFRALRQPVIDYRKACHKPR
ncbi:heme-binding protein [Nocardia transvalensis]|uniref:heme-binding protein n=1 Tax=Nocardia transvalensis TaxID=37333 RepID=UPI001894B7CE|nr:heme-binding protein [Nocardia transvalensis]MBF6327283.1 hemophore-related protein [Nocardia transvalensis]